MSISILVVDDEPDVAELFRQRFRRETRRGTYVLHYANSAAEALNRLAGEIEPELLAVLSDINMPGMDGLELLGEIKQRFPDLPVMMVTAYGDDDRRRRASALGAAELITKPVDFDLLKAQLAQLQAGPIEKSRAPMARLRLDPIDPSAAVNIANGAGRAIPGARAEWPRSVDAGSFQPICRTGSDAPPPYA